MKELYYLLTKKGEKVQLCLMLDNVNDNQQLFEWDNEAADTIRTILKQDNKLLYSYDLRANSKLISYYIKDKLEITELIANTTDIKSMVLRQNLKFQQEILEKYGIKPSFSRDSSLNLDIKCQLISILKSNFKT